LVLVSLRERVFEGEEGLIGAILVVIGIVIVVGDVL